MRLPCSPILELREVGLDEKLRLGELEVELLLLGRRQAPARVDELTARSLTKPLAVMALAFTGREDHAARELFDPDVERMVREEICRVHLVMGVRELGNLRHDLL